MVRIPPSDPALGPRPENRAKPGGVKAVRDPSEEGGEPPLRHTSYLLPQLFKPHPPTIWTLPPHQNPPKNLGPEFSRHFTFANQLAFFRL